MDALTSIATAASGLPWWAAFVVAMATLAVTKGIDAAIRWRRSRLDERQYIDGETKAGYQALIEELKNRIDKLELAVGSALGELKDARLAHAKCEVEQAALKGKLEVQAERMNTMQEKLDALVRHEKVQFTHVENIKQRIKEIDPNADLPPPQIEPLN